MKTGEEVLIDLEPGKKIIVKLLSVSTPNEEGIRIVFFKVNGENSLVEIKDKSLNIIKNENTKVDANDIKQLGAPLQGLLYKVLVKKGQEIKKNDHLFVIEAMKMETTVTATRAGKVKSIRLKPGVMVKKDDLIVTME
jgi:pyruvate carboxylase